MKNIKSKLKKIKLLLLDVDGVMTDGRVIYTSKGEELRNFYINDGFGILLFIRSGLKIAIVTAKSSAIVKRRAKALGIKKVYDGTFYKRDMLENVKKDFKVTQDQICFIGDEIIDISLFRQVGVAVTVPDAMDDVKKYAHFVTKKSGGKGAVREVIEMILKAQGKWEAVAGKYYK